MGRVLRRGSRWAGYAACAWALLFSGQSFYYAAGGTAGADTWTRAIAEPVAARDPTWIALLWATGAAKVLIGLLALALGRPRGGGIPRRPLLLAGWGAGALLALYGGANGVQHGLMVAGVIRIPEGLGRTAALWHLFLWDPYWLVGGILFVVAARRYRRASRLARAAVGGEASA